MKKFYKIQSEFGYSPLQYVGPIPEEYKSEETMSGYTDAGLDYMDAVKCGMAKPPVIPLPYKTYSGGKIGDYHASGVTLAYAVVSDNFKQCLSEFGISGFLVNEAVITRGKRTYNNYWALHVTGRIEVLPYPKHRIFKSWDGTDFFVDDIRLFSLYCTERVKKAVEDSKLKGATFTEVMFYEM